MSEGGCLIVVESVNFVRQQNRQSGGGIKAKREAAPVLHQRVLIENYVVMDDAFFIRPVAAS